MHERSVGTDSSTVAWSGDVDRAPQQESLATVALHSRHKVADFACSRSDRVTDFLQSKAAKLEEQNYCRVFIYENPADADDVWAYYTLTASLLVKEEISTQHQKRIPQGLPVPLIRIGFMGRSDTSQAGLGAGLIVDAARRVFRNRDIAAWGLMLDAEGANPQLMAYYQSCGFTVAKKTLGAMYAPFKKLLPELMT